MGIPDMPLDEWMAANRERRRSLEAAGQPALERLVEHARGDTGQAHVVRRFLLGLYNGYSWPVDLTSLRELDQAIADDVVHVLAMDMAPRCEVHQRIDDGEEIWSEFAERESSHHEPR